MKLRWLIPVAVLFLIQLHVSGQTTSARIATLTINPAEVTPLHLRPEFESTIRMPEDVTSVILSNPGEFKAEHNEGEPEYVYVKPIIKGPVQSNLLIATKSGLHVTLELISDGAAHGIAMPIDFLIEYRVSKSFLTTSDAPSPVTLAGAGVEHRPFEASKQTRSESVTSSALEVEFAQQQRVNAPSWTKWDRKEIETSIGDVRQWSNRTVISYFVLNRSDHSVEIVPPQIQIAGRKARKKKKKEGKGIISDQLEIRSFRLSRPRSCRCTTSDFNASACLPERVQD